MTTLMNVSVKCEYALRAILDLTLYATGNPVRIADIANRQRIPQKFLELILGELKRYGFLESRRGAEGGYLLARPAELLFVGEVIRAVEGARSGRPEPEESPLEGMWRQVDEAIGGVVDRKSFSELARDYTERSTKHVPNFEI